MADKNKFESKLIEGMNLSIYGKSVQVTDAMKNYAIEKLSKIEKLHGHLLDVHVYLDIQKIEHHVSIVAHLSHFKMKVEAVTTDMYASIDKAVDKLQAVIKKWKSRLQDHHKKPLHAVDMQVNVIRALEDELDEFNKEIEAVAKKEFSSPKLMSSEVVPLKTLTLTEAMMKLDLSGDVFLVYKSEEDRMLKVLYRRKDGNYGLINAQG